MPRFREHVLAEASLGRTHVGRRQARPPARRALRSSLAAQPGDQRAEREEIDRVGVVVARQHVVDALRLLARERAEHGQAHAFAEPDGRAVDYALEIERLHRRPRPGQRAIDRREMPPHQVDDADADGRADVGEQLGGFARRRRFGDGRKRVGHSAACLDSWPITVKNEAVLGCLGSSIRPSLRRATRASLPRTMRPSLRLGIGLRAIGTASAAV